MALVPPPAPEDLDTFSHGATDVFDAAQKSQAIDMAASLFWMATGLTEYTDVEEVDKIIKWGLLDMAWSLLVKTENKTEQLSGYSSERIGSYSYSMAQKQIQSGHWTGVEWFAAAIMLLLNATDGAGAVWSTTEHVFEQPYKKDTVEDLFRDPSINGSGSWQ